MELGLSGRKVVCPMSVVKDGSTIRRAVAPSATPRRMPVHCEVMSCPDPPLMEMVGLSGQGGKMQRKHPAMDKGSKEKNACHIGGLSVAKELVIAI